MDVQDEAVNARAFRGEVASAARFRARGPPASSWWPTSPFVSDTNRPDGQAGPISPRCARKHLTIVGCAPMQTTFMARRFR